MSERPRVALLVETSLAFGREVIQGIADYCEQNAGWSIFLDQRELGAEPPRWLTHRRWDGIISRVTTPKLARAIRRMKVASVDLTDRAGNVGLPRLLADHVGIGRIAAEHLLDRGFQNFASCGFTKEAWSDQRLKGFRERIAEEGLGCATYDSLWTGPDVLPWDTEEERLGQWLRTLPLPVGVFACNDHRGQQVLESCRRVGLSVPGQLAVLGVDNDVTMCRLSDPPLSSVVPNARRIGFEAAELLDRQMCGEAAPADDTLIPPARVVPRRSSDTFAVEDADLSSALKYIRENACGGLNVDDVLQHTAVSRSLLERRFREELGRSPHSQIRQVQIDRAIELLTETELPLKSIAPMAGFKHVEYLSYLFKKSTGLTPGEYRRQHGLVLHR